LCSSFASVFFLRLSLRRLGWRFRWRCLSRVWCGSSAQYMGLGFSATIDATSSDSVGSSSMLALIAVLGAVRGSVIALGGDRRDCLWRDRFGFWVAALPSALLVPSALSSCLGAGVAVCTPSAICTLQLSGCRCCRLHSLVCDECRVCVLANLDRKVNSKCVCGCSVWVSRLAVLDVSVLSGVQKAFGLYAGSVAST
jgi:hypothetical protein